MITDARALRPQYVPRDLEARDGQIDHLSSILAPLQSGYAENACIFGPTGTGKTTIAKYVVGRLERETLGIRWGYVDAMSDNTPAAALHGLVRDLNLGADLRRRGEPTSIAIERIRDCDDQIVAILDEVALLDERPLLALADLPDVSVVAITIDEEEWMAGLSSRATSRIQSAASIHLERYSLDELVEILDSRVEYGLIRSRVDDEAIRRMADIAAGDARRAIALLRRSAQRVEQGKDDELTLETVERARSGAENDIRERRVRSLGTHQRLLYTIINEAEGDIHCEDLHTEYERRAQDPLADSTRRKCLRSLQQYDLIDASGSGRARYYRSLA